MKSYAFLAKMFCAVLLGLFASVYAVDSLMYGFEGASDIQNWTTRTTDLRGLAHNPVLISSSTTGATQGTKSMQLIFQGGRLPGVSATVIPKQSWYAPNNIFKADVTVNHECMVFFRGITQTAGDGVTGFEKMARLSKGLNHVRDKLCSNPYSGYGCIWGNMGDMVSFEIFMYYPEATDTMYVDNIALSQDPLTASAPPSPFYLFSPCDMGDENAWGSAYPWTNVFPSTYFNVLGAGGGNFTSIQGDFYLAKRTAWVDPTVAYNGAQAESLFTIKYDSLKNVYPNAVMAIFREGDTGYDPNNPSAVYTGWKDSHINAHNPYEQHIFDAQGSQQTIEVFQSHRTMIAGFDISSIPQKKKVLAARLILQRSQPAQNDEYSGPHKNTMWDFMACRKPWVETEVNCFQYATGKLWQGVNGRCWGGSDPDYLYTVIAYGQSQLDACWWDFTEAVRLWVTGSAPNYGFKMDNVGYYGDQLFIWSREAPIVKNRPALMVVYDPTQSDTTVMVPTALKAPQTKNLSENKMYSYSAGSNVIIKSNSRDPITGFTVYDITGKMVYSSAGKNFPACVVWNGRDINGKNVTNGLYFLKTITGKGNTTLSKINLVR